MVDRADFPETQENRADSPAPDRMLKWFIEFDHSSDMPRQISAVFAGLASEIIRTIQPGPERTVALRKLLESKDAAVRATVHAGG